jgi:hypothetical protein
MSGSHGGGLGHRRGVLGTDPVYGRPQAAWTAPGAPKEAPRLHGFRHFLATPRPEQQFRIKGADPRANPAETQRLMRGLSLLMMRGDFVPNPTMPAGYTYLLQLAAHDLVRTTTPLWALGPGLDRTRNARITRLGLDTVYGDGPGGCPFAYAPDDPADASRNRLRLGCMDMRRVPEGLATGAEHFRDLARLGSGGTLGALPDGLSEPLIPDARNDDNGLLSQVTVLFHLLHNLVLATVPPPAGSGATLLRDLQTRFAAVREAVVAVYHQVLREDLLKRLLHPAVYAHYTAPGALFADETDRLAIPRECAFGTLRAAHAMPRESYVTTNYPSPHGPHEAVAEFDLSDVVRQSSCRAPESMPATPDWILRWSNFFELPAAGGAPAPRLNLAGKFLPRVSSGMGNLDLFPPIDESGTVGIAYRDMISAALGGLWSVAPLLARLAEEGPAWQAMLAQSALADPAARQAALAAWIGARRGISGFRDEDVAALAADPPLPLYVLIEAQHDCAGEKLGVLGSVIMAETFFAAFDPDGVRGVPPWQGLPARLEEIRRDYGLAEAPGGAALAAVADMPGLIAHLAAQLGWARAYPPFV